MQILVITSSRICYIWASDQRRMRVEYATERFSQMSKIGQMSLESKNSFDWKPEEKYRVRIANEEAYFNSLKQANKFMLDVKLKKYELQVSKFFMSAQKSHLIKCAAKCLKHLNYQRLQKLKLLLIASVMSQVLGKQKRALDRAVKLITPSKTDKGLAFHIDFGSLQLKKTLTEAESIKLEIYAWKVSSNLLIHSTDFHAIKFYHNKILYECTQRAIQLNLKENYNVIQFLIKLKDRPLAQAKIDKLMCRTLRQRRRVFLTLNKDRQELGLLQVNLFSPVHSVSCLIQEPSIQLDPLFLCAWQSPPLVFNYRLGCSLFLGEQLWSDGIPQIEHYRQRMVRNKCIEYGKLISVQQRLLHESSNLAVFTRSQRIGKYMNGLGVSELKRTLIHTDQQTFFKVLALRYQENQHSSKFEMMHKLTELKSCHPYHIQLAKKVVCCLLGLQDQSSLLKIKAHSCLPLLVITVCKIVVFSEVVTENTYRSVFWIVLGFFRIFGQFREGALQWLNMQSLWAQRLITRLGLDQDKVAGAKVNWLAQNFKLVHNCFAQLHMNCVLMIYDSLVASLERKPTLLISFSLGLLMLTKQISKGNGKYQFDLNLQALLGFVPSLKLLEQSRRISQMQIDLSEKKAVRSLLPKSCLERGSRMSEAQVSELFWLSLRKHRSGAKKISILVEYIQRKQFQYVLIHGQSNIKIQQGNEFHLRLTPDSSSLRLTVRKAQLLLGQAALRALSRLPANTLLSEEITLHIQSAGMLEAISVHLWVKWIEGDQGQQRNKKQELDLYGFRFDQQFDLKSLIRYSSPMRSDEARETYQQLWNAVCGEPHGISKDYPFDCFILTLLCLPIDLQKRIILLYNFLKAFLYVDSKLIYLLQKILQKHYGLQLTLAPKELALKFTIIAGKVEKVDITRLMQTLIQKHKQKFLSGDLVLGSLGEMSLLRGYLPREVYQKVRESKSFELQVQKHGKKGFFFKEVYKVDSQTFKVIEPAVCLPTVRVTEEQFFSLDEFVQTFQHSPFFLTLFACNKQIKSQGLRIIDLGTAIVYVTQHEVDLHFEEDVVVATPYHTVQHLLHLLQAKHISFNLAIQTGLSTRLHALPAAILYGESIGGKEEEQRKECLVFRVCGESREAVQGRVSEGGEDMIVQIGNSLVKVSGITVIN